MYGAVQAIGNLDVDTIDRYQVAKRKGTRIIQKCNELLDAVKKNLQQMIYPKSYLRKIVQQTKKV